MGQITSCSLLISTYNWPSALELCLMSALQQTVLPAEIVIADDGSTEETRELIERIRKTTRIPIKHAWQKDEGFQAGKIRNKAIALTTTDYIIQIDGDIIMHPYCIEDHLGIAEEGFFIAGSRTLFNKELTDLVIKTKRINFGIYTKGSSNVLNGLRIKFLREILSTRFKVSGKNLYDAKGCNMSFWKKDLIAVNGYDEAYVGWGKEDTDLTIRLMNSGMKKKYLKMGGIAYHLFHKLVPRDKLQENIDMMNIVLEKRNTWAEVGLNQYLKTV